MTDNYEDIINLPHHVSNKHPQMSMINRAAQFAPFAALTGHDAAIQETARYTADEMELTEAGRDELDRKMSMLLSFANQPDVSITFFHPDEKKNGGVYRSVSSKIKRIDSFKQLILMSNGTIIPFRNVLDIVLHDEE